MYMYIDGEHVTSHYSHAWNDLTAFRINWHTSREPRLVYWDGEMFKRVNIYWLISSWCVKCSCYLLIIAIYTLFLTGSANYKLFHIESNYLSIQIDNVLNPECSLRNMWNINQNPGSFKGYLWETLVLTLF